MKKKKSRHPLTDAAKTLTIRNEGDVVHFCMNHAKDFNPICACCFREMACVVFKRPNTEEGVEQERWWFCPNQCEPNQYGWWEREKEDIHGG